MVILIFKPMTFLSKKKGYRQSLKVTKDNHISIHKVMIKELNHLKLKSITLTHNKRESYQIKKGYQ